mgnify:CR=1 FL=1
MEDEEETEEMPIRQAHLRMPAQELKVAREAAP